MNITKIATLFAAITLLTACGEAVNIPSGEVGKELGTDGFETGIREPGGFKLATCPFSACSKLIRLQVFETAQAIPGNFFLPKSNLDFDLSAVIRYRVRKNHASMTTAFSTVQAVPSETSYRVSIITVDQLFKTFIAPRVTDTIREALGGYQIEEVMENLGEVRTFVENRLKAAVADTPVEILSVNFESINWPKSVLEAKRRIAEVESDRLAKTKQVTADLEIAAKQRELDILRARIDNEVDAITSEFMGPKMAMWRMLEILDKATEKSVPITIHPSMFPQNAFDMAQDGVRYDQVPTAPTITPAAGDKQ